VNIDRFLVGCVGEMHSLLENARRKEKKRKEKEKEKEKEKRGELIVRCILSTGPETPGTKLQ
jgi:hypothetical protein